MYENSSLSYRFVPAIIIAFLCHLMILMALGPMPQLPAPQSPSVLEITLAAPQPPASAVQPSPETIEEQRSDIVSSQTETPLTFPIPDDLPQSPRNFRPPSADSTWIDNLFTSQDSLPDTLTEDQGEASPDEVPRISTAPLPVLNSYHQQLIQILARHQYHDDQYSFTRLAHHHRVVLNLTLHPSGVLLRASIKESSGDSELDAAAQRSAYAASPYPPPPTADAKFNYRYPVEIIYQPR